MIIEFQTADEGLRYTLEFREYLVGWDHSREIHHKERRKSLETSNRPTKTAKKSLNLSR